MTFKIFVCLPEFKNCDNFVTKIVFFGLFSFYCLYNYSLIKLNSCVILAGYATARTKEKFLKSGQGRKWLDKLEAESKPAIQTAGKARL